MATRFNNHMAAHVWAQQSQPRGQSNNGNLFFEHDTLYSYSYGFPVGRFVANARGERAVLLNSRHYSVTTSAHQQLARMAVDGLGLPIFKVPGCLMQHAENLRYFETRAIESFEKADRARVNRAWRLEDANDYLGAARRYAKFFDLDWDWAGADQARARWQREAAEQAEQERQYREALQRARLERQRAERITQREQFRAWQKGERDYAPSAYNEDDEGSAYLRVRGDKLETSKGAEVPLDHAKRAFRLIKRCHDRGEGWRPNGHSVCVGHFTVDEITAEGNVRAGCHYITWPHIEAAAIEAGVFAEAEAA